MNLNELLTKAEQLAAGVGQDAMQSVLVDSGLTAELLATNCIRWVIHEAAKNGQFMPELQTSHTVAITAGEGNLPSGVLTEAFDSWEFAGHPFLSILQPADYERFKYSISFEYVTVSGTKIKFSNGSSPYTGSLTFKAPTEPTITNATTPIALSDVVLDEVALVIAAVLRGDIPLSQILISTQKE